MVFYDYMPHLRFLLGDDAVIFAVFGFLSFEFYRKNDLCWHFPTHYLCNLS